MQAINCWNVFHTQISYWISVSWCLWIWVGLRVQGVPKKIFEFLSMGGVFLGAKNNSKNFEDKKIIGCLEKFWVNGPCLSEKDRK